MKKVKKLRKILFLALACSLLMSLVCVNAFAGQTMGEGTYNGGYYQARIELNESRGDASLQYSSKVLLQIKGTVYGKKGGVESGTQFSQNAVDTECNVWVTHSSGATFTRMYATYTIKATVVEQLSTTT